MAKFGELLAELRQDRKMTQGVLAEILHVTTGTISNYEKGAHFPDVEKLVNLADYFQVTVDYLLGRCEHNLSPDVFAEMITEKKTVGEVVRAIKLLPPDRREALALILDDMEFRTAVNRYSKKESQ